jgi:hypothetical protein
MVSVHYRFRRKLPRALEWTKLICRHTNDNDIYVCHTSCAIQNGGTLSSYLQKVTSWVSANPNDVVTLIIVNIDNLPATTFAQSFSSAGLEQYMYSPTAGQLTINEWPTLGSLVDSGKRVLAFMDNQADFSQVPWLIDEFSNMFEDAYGECSCSSVVLHASKCRDLLADSQMLPSNLSAVD